MIVIVASRFDASACRFKDRWTGGGAHLFTCADLSISGWRCRLNDQYNSTAIIEGLTTKQSDIAGVLTRLRWVWGGELVNIVPEDRAYVAAEMSAFLVFWLSGLICPILNRPTANSLNGPGWDRERWNFEASKVGMRTTPIRRRASLASPSTWDVEVHDRQRQVSVTVVGNNCVGDAHVTLLEQARRLASAAKVDFLSVQFSSAEASATFTGADIFPDINNASIADAAFNYFGGA
jgi:hypothetical protein